MKSFLTILLYLLITITSSIIANGCFEAERNALLAFKAGLYDPDNVMSSWHNRDCCNWSGVRCDVITQHVVKLHLANPHNPYDLVWASHALTGDINPALLSLKHLTHLDLSNQDFSNSTIPKFIGSFKNLVYLNLSFCGFQGVIPHELGNLSRIQFLDLSYSQFQGTVPPQIWNLSVLQYLSLRSYFQSSSIGSLSWLPSSNLRYLDLSGIFFNNTVDWSAINKMHMLQTLILSDCFISKMLIDLSHNNLTSLTKLDLSGNSFQSTVPNWLWNLTSLLYLDLGWSGFHGKIPSALTKLVSLNYLCLGWNNFDHAVIEPISKLNNLRSLDLSFLDIGGDILNLIERLGSMWSELEVVRLPNNNFSGNISCWITHMKNLSIIDLSYNSLFGQITSRIGKLAQLKELDLSYNSLYGVITQNHFLNLSKLKVLDLSNNKLVIEINDKWVPPFQLRELNLRSCKVGPRFPMWLQWQKLLSRVGLSNTSITGAIPIWFWNLYSENIQLSYNNIIESIDMLYNNIMDNSKPSMWYMRALELSNNNIYGSFPDKLEFPNLEYLSLSNNRINGSITYSICGSMPYLTSLELSNNFISGEIPICWKDISYMEIIDLSNNKIMGQLLDSIGSLQYLTILQLYNNMLYGEIPSTLQQCNQLVFLSLGRNNFSGKIPPWIGKQLQNLVIFQLRSNKFSGFIPSELGELENLQILDLSHNELVGPIPKSVGNYSSMKNSSEYYTRYYYEDTALYVDINGEHVYTSMPLGLAKTIDMSGNNLNGHIPEEIWLLNAMINLNLSKKILVGEVSELIGRMRSLESLDLSFNDFSGPIPQVLSNLSSLHNMNLSYNNFSGRIPTGRQLDTINVPSIYVGNSYLCGPPSGKNCSENQTSRGINIAIGENERDMAWFYLALALGFILGFWSLLGILLFQNTWKITYFRLIDNFFDKIYVHLVLATRRLGWW